MFVDLQVAFAMLSLCYAQWPNYLQRTIFPSPSILQHYTKFDARTIAMLEKLLGSRSFGTTSGPFGSLSSHSSCFFEGVKPSISGQTCYPHLFRMLGFDRSCTSISFLVG
jgi:hypothetical protein